MHASFRLVVVSALLFSCGGKVIFDTGSTGAGGATSTNPSSTHGSGTTVSSTKATTVNSVNSGVTVGQTGSTAIAVTTGTGPGCVDPGAPPGSTVGTTDCGFMPCNAASNCFEACSALYDCGLAMCGPGGKRLCPGMNDSASEHDIFAQSLASCLGACQSTPAFKSIVDPTDCVQTIQTFNSLAAPFKQFCMFGPGQG